MLVLYLGWGFDPWFFWGGFGGVVVCFRFGVLGTVDFFLGTLRGLEGGGLFYVFVLGSG